MTGPSPSADSDDRKRIAIGQCAASGSGSADPPPRSSAVWPKGAMRGGRPRGALATHAQHRSDRQRADGAEPPARATARPPRGALPRTAASPAMSAIVRATRRRRSVPRPESALHLGEGDGPPSRGRRERSRRLAGRAGDSSVQRRAAGGWPGLVWPLRSSPRPSPNSRARRRRRARRPAASACRPTGRSGRGAAPRSGRRTAPAPRSGTRTGPSLPVRPQRHGFIAATNWNRAGKIAVRAARAIATRPSSSGWRSASRTSRPNSGSSSRKRTPWSARVTSPGASPGPPPTIAAYEAV